VGWYRLECDVVVVVVAERQEGVAALPFRHLQAEHGRVEMDGAVEVTDAQVDVAEVRHRRDDGVR